jgi:Reverse transcriptase (RNA-dependent DNA polymerase)
VNPLFHGLSTGQPAGPTLKAVRRMVNLRAALHQINRRPVGVDGIPFEAFLDPIGYLRWNPNLLDAYPDLNPVRTVQESLTECPIPDASQALQVEGRNLERGTVANRIVERAIIRKLNATLDHCFSNRSFGFRPGRSPEEAILEVRRVVRGGAHWALKTDFKDFFGSVDRCLLERMVRGTIADQDLCNAVMAATSPAVVDNGRTLLRLGGLPQGNGLSPWLSNLYLHGFDEACGHLLYFRYVDDIFVLGASWQEVMDAYRHIRRLARSLKLRLNPKKTYVADLHKKPLVFLGYELRGGNIYPPERAILGLRQKLELRGNGDRKALMMSFVHRFRIGPVRKLFRRLDRQLCHLFPLGLSLVRLLEAQRRTNRDR